MAKLNDHAASLLHEIIVGNGYINLEISYDTSYSYGNFTEKDLKKAISGGITCEDNWETITIELNDEIFEDDLADVITKLEAYYAIHKTKEFNGFKFTSLFTKLEGMQ